ncbi:hypothetical protein CONPUDRAFT_152311 [Coniophora puteana RWD-64-598 SS2]|uniref:Uncharacterized protein n=1 Tax=Coniophora puteana (strain RWD-64-598) TaxID=741705 RepID=A0A5M3MX43_CONPW|nr:uncharacterized protein CONPUDRAFT_152311 [Coniophora puteana RWD-64-598 SS2]EIW83285.1 hypothetical protein CONPUDRAFT_152311 [Coniophora puteana RWD-64-598 SS2]
MAPSKTHRAGASGLQRSHSRTSTSSRLGISNLQLTQKEPKPADRSKKNGHTHDDAASNHSVKPRGVQRVASGFRAERVPSREQMQHAARYAANQNQQRGQKAKAGFTISSPSPGQDEDDEWVSSESGAVSPTSSESEDEDIPEAREILAPPITPVEPRKSAQPSIVLPPPQTFPPPAQAPEHMDSPILPDTPRAALADPISSQATAARPPEVSVIVLPAASVPRGPVTGPPKVTEQLSMFEPPAQQQQSSHLVAPAPPLETRSENTSPVQRSKQTTLSRPTSMHGTAAFGRGDVPLRPHPLIRGQSFGQHLPMSQRVGPLAPLTVRSDLPPAQISASPPQSNTAVSTSPSNASIKSTSHSPPHRRPSVSSARSVATLPSGAVAPAQTGLSKPQVDRDTGRNRTLSTASNMTSSSMQRLSSLAAHSQTRPATPQYVSKFPPASQTAGLEAVHPLLPSPYLGAHLFILPYRSPLRESYDRVAAAKQRLKR